MEEKHKSIERLLSMAAQNPPKAPKSTFSGAKCPLCNNKLSKETVKELVTTFGDSAELINKLPNAAALQPGAHNLAIEHFTCKCGYQYVKTDVSSMTDF